MMENAILMTMSKDEFRNEIESILLKTEKKSVQLPKVYSINRVAKTLGLANATVKKLIKSGLIKTTKSGLISEDAITEYLQG